ncbi:CaiB/BaiF CoA transferase family protein [Burkholderia ambifaria]|uniref:CaiB/BaiF CoA transferase family protein n=1 Tax=Burkholderia ambifaria TaxID=152480 RepID=UPI000F805D96|nr:CaiB/BaiF CoA-transferase family protein [Burkholderia ambifaria]WAS58531.1 CoA transferase [Burkholderia ambifaria]WDR97733.1 CaiB/BaiF CoA-transferase family protein [Burkholderia ambifaria]
MTTHPDNRDAAAAGDGKPAWSCLNDVKILDVSQLLPGPHACALLRQLGADVVKIEPPGTGDASRLLGDAVFAQFNRGKRSVMLDLKAEADRERFLALVRDADAVVEGFRPGVMARLGLGYDVLARANPRIVLCSISGYGQDGPNALRAGHDLNFLAEAGYWTIPAQLDDAVARPRVRLADYAASLHAALALSVAVMSARASGAGQHLDVSIHDTVLAWTAPAAWASRAHRMAPGDAPWVMPDNDLFETADGRHIALGILEDKFWATLGDVLGDAYPALRDSRFSRRVGRQRHKQEVGALLRDMFASRTLVEWMRALRDHDLPVSPLPDADELFADPHVQARGVMRVVPGSALAVRFPVKFSLGLPDGDDHVPALGEHGD